MKKFKYIYCIFTCLYGSAIAFFSTTIYLFMQKVGYSVADINLFISIFWVISFLAEIPSGMFSDTFGRRNTALISCFIRAIGLVSLVVSDGNMILLIISGVLTALGSAFNSGTMTSWIIDEIRHIDEKYNFTVLFSKINTLNGVLGLFSGYVGAQILGITNLSYSIWGSIILFIVSGLFLMIYVKNDNPQFKELNFSNSYILYKNTIIKSIQYLKNTPQFLLICMLPVGMAFLTTPAYNQWQLYFKNDNMEIISGYIHIWITVLGLLGTYLMSKVKIKNSLLFLKVTYILIFMSLILSVIINNLYISLLFFGVHVMIISMNILIQFTYSNNLIKSDIRSSLVSINYAIEALFTVIIIFMSTWLIKFFGMGISWTILGIVGIVFLLFILGYLKKYETE